MRHFAFVTSVGLALGPLGCVDRLIVEESAAGGSQSASGGRPGTDARDDPEDGDRDANGEVDTGASDSDVEDSQGCGADPDDCDGDGIPDRRDPFPSDPSSPGTVEAGVLYANTRDALYAFTPAIDWQPDFVVLLDTGGDAITDIAIDKFDVLYAVSSSTLFVCNPQTGVCDDIAELSGVNAAGFIPNVDDPATDDALHMANASGDWYVATLRGASADIVRLGAYPDGVISAGDITDGVGIVIASVEQAGQPGIALVEPGTVNVQAIQATASQPWGISLWEDQLIWFSPDGAVNTSGGVVFQNTSIAWWGAAGNEF